jgi:phage/conjugal plasmid C-4 type zinc finger TraR family protein
MSSVAAPSAERPLPRLEARRSGVAQLLQSLELAERQELGVEDVHVVGAVDDMERASSVQGRDAANLLTEILSGNQLQIEHALQRMTDGWYGLCEDCHGPIPRARLTARPEATRCVECQRRHELGAAS